MSIIDDNIFQEIHTGTFHRDSIFQLYKHIEPYPAFTVAIYEESSLKSHF